MFAVHRVDDKLLFEIPRKELNKDMLLVGRYARAAANPYFAGYLDGDYWLVIQLAGVVIGGFLSALLAGRVRFARRS